MKLRIRAFGLTTGIVLGLAVFLLTMVYLIFNYESSTLVKLHKVFPGFDITFVGGVLGLVWGFVYGVIGGAIFAWLYNKLQGLFK
jgi:hypothetical protein